MELEGRITRIDRGRALVAVGDEQHSVVDTGEHDLTVGDRVRFEGEALVELLPRSSLLTRLGADGEPQPIAANVDVVVVVAGLDRPVKAGRLLRATTQAWEAGSTPLIVLTKSDLEDPEPVIADLGVQLVGVDVLAVSSKTGNGMDDLRDRLAGRTAVLLGESGAGKSSLINALTEGDELVGEVRESDAKGRHTTTWRQLVDLPGGGALIDTPGVRSLGLWADAESVEAAFTDIADLAEHCRFRDCSHDSEPGCAVRAAVEDGSLAAERIDQYHSLRREAESLERRTDAHAEKQAGRRTGRMYKEAKAERRRKGDDSV
ncbi:MAG TPA: ribosome small subunit-dependent GTPase A [Acidimicrobiales bacterium]|nr:ribosome small subunit-dependent GTPase A [Acidimicrobiales bacterium]